MEKANWNKTQNMFRRLEGRLDNGLYGGRHIIHRDTPILGGVCLGGQEREAIVVDTKYGELNKLYEKAKEKATSNGVVRKELILDAVYEIVKEAMPLQNDEAVDALVTAYRAGKDRKIALDVFIKNRVGFCRHNALACGALLELFKRDGYVGGRPSIDRNSTLQGGHAWCRYTNSGGEIYILDVHHGFLGGLEESMGKWPYSRPEDKK